MHRYSISARTTNAPTATLPGASLYAPASISVYVYEIGVFNTTATACAVAVNRLASAATQGAGLTEAKIGDSEAPAASGAGFQSHTSTPPTLGDELVRASLGAAIGSGAIWTFDQEPLRIPSGTANGIGLICPTGTGQILDFYMIFSP